MEWGDQLQGLLCNLQKIEKDFSGCQEVGAESCSDMVKDVKQHTEVYKEIFTDEELLKLLTKDKTLDIRSLQ